MDIGRTFVLVGAVLIVFGAALLLLPKDCNPIAWFGHLPGDIHYKNDRTEVWIPWVSMLVVSIVLSTLLWFIRMVRG